MPKTKPWRELRNRTISADRRAKIDAEVRDEIAHLDAVTKLEQLRRARNFSQQQLAEQLGTNQSGVSRLERQADLYLSTLRRFVHALGGEVEVLVQFHDATEPIRLDLFSDLEPPRSLRAAREHATA